MSSTQAMISSPTLSRASSKSFQDGDLYAIFEFKRTDVKRCCVSLVLARKAPLAPCGSKGRLWLAASSAKRVALIATTPS